MKNIYILFLLFLGLTGHTQSWQWAKRGGALEALFTIPAHDQEEVYSLATDSHKNIYGLSRVGYVGLNIDGVPKTSFDNPSENPSDYTLFSFACDGSYRWSKIIGGMNTEIVNSVQVDGQNNVYISGKFGDCTTNASYPFRIDSDFINTHYDCRILYLAKYNENGTLQWFKRPQALGVDVNESYTETRSAGLQIDAMGNSYWLLRLPPGIYADGAFINSVTGSNWFILQYDSEGNYISNKLLDIQTSLGFTNLHFQRNSYNGQFYIYAGKIDISDTATIGGNAVSHTTFLASFDALGNFLWKREDTFTNPNYLNIYNLDFDAQNNIYIGGKIAGFSLGSFLGLTVPESILPSFVMKTNSTATQVLWSSYSNKNPTYYGGIVLNGNELAYTTYCYGVDFTWGTQTLNASATNQGQEVLLARFNKDTGACIGLNKIPGSIGFNDVGASITADASGDYILGGAIGGSMFLNNGQQIDNAGSQSDFFVAKYSTEVCSLGVNDGSRLMPLLYPNPTNGLVHFDNSSNSITKVSVYNYLGQEVIQAIDFSQNDNPVIDLNGLPNGVYLVKLSGEKGTFSTKIVKQ